MTRKAFVAVAAVVLVCQGAWADQHSLGDRIRACAEMADDTRRLACFDREADVLSDTGEEVRAATEPTSAVVAETAAGEEVRAATEATQNVVGETAVRAAADSNSVDEFGMTPELVRSKPEMEVETELREISAKAVKVTRRPRGELTITLDNGQTWTEKDAEYGFRVKVGDTVVIKKGNMGGYRMVGRGRRSSQVRRID